jgi:hypothetical protein
MTIEPECDLRLRSLDEAVRLLREFRHDLAPGSLSVWKIIDHACKHLDSQIRAALKDDGENESIPPACVQLQMSELLTADRQSLE